MGSSFTSFVCVSLIIIITVIWHHTFFYSMKNHFCYLSLSCLKANGTTITNAAAASVAAVYFQKKGYISCNLLCLRKKKEFYLWFNAEYALSTVSFSFFDCCVFLLFFTFFTLLLAFLFFMPLFSICFCFVLFYLHFMVSRVSIESATLKSIYVGVYKHHYVQIVPHRTVCVRVFFLSLSK